MAGISLVPKLPPCVEKIREHGDDARLESHADHSVPTTYIQYYGG